MIENLLGKVSLTKNQISRIGSLHDSTIKGFFVDDSGVIVKTLFPLSDPEKDSIRTSLLALSDDPLPVDLDKTDYQNSVLRGLTPTQADTWIQNNVTDLASAKVALRHIVRVLIYLVRRSGLR